jgi:hypothetical protein
MGEGPVHFGLGEGRLFWRVSMVTVYSKRVGDGLQLKKDGFLGPFRGLKDAGRLQSSLDSAKAYVPSFGEVVFPDADDSPTVFPQRSIYQTVSGLVCSEFLLPESAVGRRGGGMFRAGVPETAVHEDNQARFPKDEIRFAEDSLISPPAGDAVRTQQFCQR